MSVADTALKFSDRSPGEGGAASRRGQWRWSERGLGGLPIAAVGLQETSDGFMAEVRARRSEPGRPFYSTSANGEVLCRAERDEAFRAQMLLADQILADGMPMVLYSRWSKGIKLPERVATTDLIHFVAEDSVRAGASFYLLGGQEEVNAGTAARLSKRYPGLKIAGRHHGYFGQSDEGDIVDRINASGADIVWIGLGVPLEQAFVARNLERLTTASVVKTCGGLFDFLSGRRSRAPKAVQAAGFEWAYRALLEPKRLGKRYLLTNGGAVRLLLTRSD